MNKGGYQIIDLSNIYFDVWSEDQEISINTPNIEVFRQITNTNKPIVISGLTLTDEFKDFRKYTYHDIILNTNFCNKYYGGSYPTIKFDIDVTNIFDGAVDTATVTITPTHIKIQSN